MISLRSESISFRSLLNDIEIGKIKIPQFQRDFVWDIKKASDLMDSLIKGYPIGTFIIWKTKEPLRIIRDLGGIKLPQSPKDDYINYILDGQQRLTSLYVSLKGYQILKENSMQDFSKMYVDLSVEGDNRIIITNIQKKEQEDIIKLNELMYKGILELAKYPEKYLQKLDDYKNIIMSYPIPIIYVEDIPMEVAVEIYTRINEGGKTLTVFEIMVAKTFSIERNFDLAEKYKTLTLRLSKVNYETIPDSTVLQTVAILLTKDCSKKSIYRLNRDEFIDIWEDAVDSIERTVDYFKSFFRIPISELLPYYALIVPFSYFFYKHNDKPNAVQQKSLQNFFWRTSLTDRYSHSQETRIAQDIMRIDSILNEKKVTYDYPIDISPKYIIENGSFTISRSYIKAILCLYVYFEPKSFNDNSKVIISKDFLKKSNSKNYHHFFPKSFLKKKKVDELLRNHILNITIVDEHLNKKEIGKRPPSIYIKRFLKENEELKETLKTHLIGDIDKFGILSDDYDEFIKMRAQKVSAEFKKRIIE